MTITIHDTDLDHLRAILREQIGADAELMRDIEGGREDDPYGEMLSGAIERTMLCHDIARQVRGLDGEGFAQSFTAYPA